MLTTDDDAAADRIRHAAPARHQQGRLEALLGRGLLAPTKSIEPGYKYNMTRPHRRARPGPAAARGGELARSASASSRSTTRRSPNCRRTDRPGAGTARAGRPPRLAPLPDAASTSTSLTIDRNGFIDALQARNIGSGIHYTALHLQGYYRERFGYRRGDLPEAE